MPSPLTPQSPAKAHAGPRARKDPGIRADIARVAVALGVLALLASFDDAKDNGLAAASREALAEAVRR
jgi:hypothetical protein